MMDNDGDLFGDAPESLGDSNPDSDRQKLLDALHAPAGPVHKLSADRLDLLLQGINSGDIPLQFTATNELNDYLSFSTDQTLAGFRTKEFVSALGGLLHCGIPDLTLISVRAMINLLEALPPSASAFAGDSNVIDSLCNILNEGLEDIEVAEVCVVALKKISESQPAAVFKGGALGSLFMLFDFFGVQQQRSICQILSNIISQLPPNAWDTIQSLLPKMTSLVTYNDKRVAEESLLCYMTLCQFFFSDESKISEICSYELLDSFRSIIAGYDSDSQISDISFVSVLRILVLICQGSVHLMQQLIEKKFCESLTLLLKNGNKKEKYKSSEFTIEIVSVLNELLPSVPSHVALFFDSSESQFGGFGQPRLPNASADSDLRAVFYAASPECLEVFHKCDLLTTLLTSFEHSVNFLQRLKIMHTIVKIIHFCPDSIQILLQSSFSFPSFIAKLIADKDLGMIASGVYLAELCMEGLPSVFADAFAREGVVDALRSLNNSPNLLPPAPKELSYRSASLPRGGLGYPGAGGWGAAAPPPFPLFGADPSASLHPIPIASVIPKKRVLVQRKEKKVVELEKKETVVEETKKEEVKEIENETEAETEIETPKKKSPKKRSKSPKKETTPKPSKVVVVNSDPLETIQPVLDDNEGEDEGLLLRPPVTPVKSSRDQLREWISTHALDFQTKYFSSENIDTQQFKQLKELSQSLIDLTKASTTDFEKISSVLASLTELIQLVSAFEYIKSGCTHSFRFFLTHLDDSHSKYKIRKKRISLFLEHFLGEKAETSSFLKIIAIIEKSIGGNEHFPTLVGSSASPVGGIKLLFQPFRFQIVRDESESRLFEYGNKAVLVEPLATVKNIQKFLLPRVTRKPKPVVEESEKSPEKKKPEKILTTETEEPKDEEPKKEEQAKGEEPKKESKKEEEPKGEVEGIKKAEPKKKEEPEKEEPKKEEPKKEDEPKKKEPKKEKASGSATGSESSKSNEEPDQEPDQEPEPDQDQDQDQDEDQDEFVLQERLEKKQNEDIISNPDDFIQLEPNESIVFFLGKKQLRPELNALQIAQLVESEQEASSIIISELWRRNISVTYKIVAASPPTPNPKYLSSLDIALQKLQTIQSFSEATGELINFLSLLFTIYQFAGSKKSNLIKVDPSQFMSRNANSKVTSQLQDPIILCTSSLPEWCMETLTNCKFLYSYETRNLFFQSTAFDVARALNAHISQMGLPNPPENRIHTLRFRVDRTKIWKSAIKVVEQCLHSKTSMLLIEYLGEKGAGAGPTREFYTLVSAEAQRRDLKMWLDNADHLTDKTLNNKAGLFPIPIIPGDRSKDNSVLLDHFRFLGSFVAKALMDHKLLDIPFSVPFYKLILGEELSFSDLQEVHPGFGDTVNALYKYQRKKHFIQNDSNLTPEEKKQKISSLKCFRGGSVEELDLTFSTPEGVLVEKGDSMDLTGDNLEEFLGLVKSVYLEEGIYQQRDAFIKGFNNFLSISSLKIFRPDELEQLLCGVCQQVSWEKNDIMEGLDVETANPVCSKTVAHLLTTLTEFQTEQRREFLTWVTGSPRLPIGGFRSLAQGSRISVFRKLTEGEIETDQDLPLAFACFSKLCLPEYSTQERMREQISFSMKGTVKYSYT